MANKKDKKQNLQNIPIEEFDFDFIPDDPNYKAKEDDEITEVTPGHLVRLISVLTVICTCVALLLSIVNGVTKDIIIENQKKQQANAVLELFPEGNNIVERTIDDNLVYLVQKENRLLGYCVSSVGRGYIDDISMMVAINADGAIKGLKIVTMSETPGIGTKVKAEQFLGGFLGISDRVVLGENVDAVANATYSSKGVAEAVNNALLVNVDLAAIATELNLEFVTADDSQNEQKGVE